MLHRHGTEPYFFFKHVLYLHGIELIRESSCVASAWHCAIILAVFRHCASIVPS